MRINENLLYSFDNQLFNYKNYNTMRNFKLRMAVISLLLAFTTTFTTSCGKDNTDVSDTDEKGTFSLTIDGTKQEGTKVFSGAAIGIRTISAENSSIELGILLDEEKFVSGATFELVGGMSYLNIGSIGAMPKSGTIKVVSTSKIELSNCVFTQYTAQTSTDISVSGYISSK